MKIDAEQLPSDTQALRQIIVELLTENETLKETLMRMRQARFGSSSEKLNDKQIQLIFEDLLVDALQSPIAETDVEENTESTDTTNHNTPKRKPRRQPLPAHLPRVENRLDLTAAEKVCPCCQGALHQIGEDSAEKLGYIPPQYWIELLIRPKYACRQCEDAVYQKPVPLSSNPKGLLAGSLQAQIVVSKYADHQPLHRQRRIMQRSGIELPVSTLSDSCAQVAAQLKPLAELIRDKMLQSSAVFTDDTILPRNNGPGSGQGRVNQSRLWVYLGGVRDGPISAYYHYTPDRRGKAPQGILANYQGFLQADAYPGYNALYLKRGQADQAVIVEVACMAHVRRKFKEATLGLRPDNAGLAFEALLQIKCLYTIEARIRDGSDAERKQQRQLEAKPVMAKFKQWLDRTVLLVGRKSHLYVALRYALNQWAGLQTYLDHGFLEIDNNAAERSMKPIALGRKNFLFVGSDKGGETAAVLYSVLETCKLNHVDPSAYLTDVLARLPTTPEQDLEKLLPYHWKAIEQPRSKVG